MSEVNTVLDLDTMATESAVCKFSERHTKQVQMTIRMSPWKTIESPEVTCAGRAFVLHCCYVCARVAIKITQESDAFCAFYVLHFSLSSCPSIV